MRRVPHSQQNSLGNYASAPFAIMGFYYHGFIFDAYIAAFPSINLQDLSAEAAFKSY